jgi:hypothetical protein
MRPRTDQEAVTAVRHILPALGTKSRSLVPKPAFLCEILRVSEEIRKTTARGDHPVKVRHKFISLLNMLRHSGAFNCGLSYATGVH